jgi:6-phosphogluconolactonase
MIRLALAPASLRFYIGTYTGPKCEGIHLADFDPAAGKIANVKLAAKVGNPSFLALHPNGQFAYAIAEVGGGAVMSFRIDAATGLLQGLNTQKAGNGPCHISLTPDGKTALVACYGGGTVSSFAIQGDGTLGPAVSTIQHQGSGPDKRRQEKPHAHSINPDPAGKFAFAADLGTDEVFVYRIEAGGKLLPHEPKSAKVAPGAGPRHFCFHPNGKQAYVINELANTVTAFAYSAAAGRLEQIANVTTLPPDFKGESYTAEVVAHPNGKFLYGSNRRHDSIAAFMIDPESGIPRYLGCQGEGVKEPRNFVIDPTGQWLLVGNQNADSIAVFKIDQTTGLLTPAGDPVPCPKPVCLRFAVK